jgi:hypothetical protein
MTTTEKNAVIGLFMGKIRKILKKDGSFDGIYCRMNGEIININYLKYHSDYNWIMPVVEKIEKEFCWVSIRGSLVEMSDIISISRPTKLESLHEAVFQFIQWYNQQQK